MIQAAFQVDTVGGDPDGDIPGAGDAPHLLSLLWPGHGPWAGSWSLRSSLAPALDTGPVSDVRAQ